MTTSNMNTILGAVSAATTDLLRARLSCEVILPGDDAYDQVRKVANLRFDRSPAAIVRARTTNDVARAVRFARTNGVPFAIRSGGHSVAGYSNPEGGILIDLSPMKDIDIDPVRKVARVQPGVTSGELAGPAHEFGLALTTGDSSSVGLGGLVTGGGIGFMVRKHGLTIDSLLSATVVTARGEILHASPKENNDLFWAIRGGGSNVGIVTEFEFKLAEAGMVYGGALVFPATAGNIRKYIDRALEAPDELTTITNLMFAPPAPFIPQEYIGQPVLMVLAVYNGDLEEGAKAVQPLRDIGGLIADVCGPIPYPAIYEFTAEAAKPAFASVRQLFAESISDDSIEAMLEAMRRGPSPMSMIQIRPLGGTMSRVSASATAFAHRDAKLFISPLGLWVDPADDPGTYQNWAQGIFDSLRHHQTGAYANFIEDEGPERVREAYPGGAYQKLALIKAKYDPDNVFSANQNVKPAASSADERAA